MPDEFGFDDADFDFDDSFLREVDDIEAHATTSKKASNGPVLGTKSIQRPLSVPKTIAPQYSGFSRPTIAGPSRLPKPPPQPSSDDQYDDFSLGPESFADIDHATSRTGSAFARTPSAPTSSSHARPMPKQTVIPSARLGMARSSSGSMNGFQTHLNFRKDNQSTKGKRWDRTEFAESGRRIVIKGKERQWGRDDDEEDEDMEEDSFEPLVPGPKPLVDLRKLIFQSYSGHGYLRLTRRKAL